MIAYSRLFQFTKRKAQELQLVGWVRNESDGSAVTGILQGTSDKVDDMLVFFFSEMFTASILFF